MTEFNPYKITNKTFLTLYKNKSRFLLLKGGAGAGKSYFAAQKLIYRCLRDDIKHRWLVLRKTNNAVYKSCQMTVEKWLQILQIPYTSTHLSIKFDGHEIIFTGLDDPMKVKSIEGITAIWMEETTEFTLKDFKQLNLRLRGNIETYKQIIMTFNPEGGKTSWIYKEFYEDAETTDRDFREHHSTWRDNRFLDEEYKRELQSEKNDTLRKIYDLGEWAELKSSIYQKYIKMSVDVTSVLRAADKIYAGVDFGFNNPAVFLLMAEHDTDVYILKEIYIRGLTNTEFIDKIRIMLHEIEEIANVEINEDMEDRVDLSTISVYCDAAEPARIKEFQQQGLRAEAANKKVKDGIDEVKRHDLIINSECLNSCKEIPMYSYKEDKDGVVLEEPIDSSDHCPDALRYGVYTSKQKGIILFV